MSKIYDHILENPKITSNYGYRTHPISGKKNSFHYGVDLISRKGNNNIYAIEDGYVQKILTGQEKKTTGYGNYIWIRYPRINLSLFHAHCKIINLKKGDKVKKGDVIAIEGKTGAATGVHLHLGMTKIGSNTWLNPEAYEYTPPNVEEVTSTVDRDEYANQLKVIASQLRVRNEHNTKSTVVGIAKKDGIYNYYETTNDSGYDWYKIAENQWIADNGKYLEVYPKKEKEDEKMIVELESKILDLENKISEYDKEILNIKNKNAKLLENNTNLEEKIKELKNSSPNYKQIFKVHKTKKYRIMLYEGETLYTDKK